MGGNTAIFVDFADVLSSKLPLFIALVVILSFILLAIVFRSFVIPATAARAKDQARATRASENRSRRSRRSAVRRALPERRAFRRQHRAHPYRARLWATAHPYRAQIARARGSRSPRRDRRRRGGLDTGRRRDPSPPVRRGSARRRRRARPARPVSLAPRLRSGDSKGRYPRHRGRSGRRVRSRTSIADRILGVSACFVRVPEPIHENVRNPLRLPGVLPLEGPHDRAFELARARATIRRCCSPTRAWCSSRTCSSAATHGPTCARPTCSAACAPAASTTISITSATPPASHVLRDARQLVVRRLFQERSDRLGVGTADRRLRSCRRIACGSRSITPTTRRSTSGRTIVGVPNERIVRIGDNKGAPYASDNFWQMADTGPCGPCTEVFYDHGAGIPGGPPGSPDEDGDRYIEIWNLVFMQFDRAARRHAVEAAGTVRRHRHGPGTARRRAAARAFQLRDRSVPASDSRCRRN